MVDNGRPGRSVSRVMGREAQPLFLNHRLPRMQYMNSNLSPNAFRSTPSGSYIRHSTRPEHRRSRLAIVHGVKHVCECRNVDRRIDKTLLISLMALLLLYDDELDELAADTALPSESTSQSDTILPRRDSLLTVDGSRKPSETRRKKTSTVTWAQPCDIEQIK